MESPIGNPWSLRSWQYAMPDFRKENTSSAWQIALLGWQLITYWFIGHRNPEEKIAVLCYTRGLWWGTAARERDHNLHLPCDCAPDVTSHHIRPCIWHTLPRAVAEPWQPTYLCVSRRDLLPRGGLWPHIQSLAPPRSPGVDLHLSHQSSSLRSEITHLLLLSHHVWMCLSLCQRASS
jgi:hypothetical protein